ncbi:MAG: type II secretion system F family protein [Bacillota bacterium]|nr:type II secretion system F family protein [Bacillota bacterium]
MKKVWTSFEVSSFCLEIALLLRSGLPLSDGLAMLAADEGDAEARRVLEQLHQSMEDGRTLADAISDCGVFPDYVGKMAQVGDKTGRLEAVFASLADYYQRQHQIARSIKNAVLYPLILVVMMLFVIIILITQVMPIFADVFAQLGTAMSPIATAILDFGVAVSAAGWPLMIALAVLIAALAVVSRLPRFRRAADDVWTRLAFSKTLAANSAVARLAAALAMGLGSGLDIDESLQLAEQLNSDKKMSARLDECRRLMSERELGFADAVTEAGIFSGLYGRMLSMGFATGSADAVMNEIARRSEEAVGDEMEKLIGRIEPTLVIVMSLIVGLILLSVMLPLMSIMSSI